MPEFRGVGLIKSPMILRLLATSLTTALLLAGTLGCSTKDDPAPTPTVGTGSYKVSRDAIAGQTRGYLQLNVNGTKVDALGFTISDTPTPQNNTRSLILYFEKPTGQPSTAYKLTGINYFPNNTNTLAMLDFTTSVATINETSTGVFSGTFSGTTASGLVLSDGIFTDARLQ
jgi:hypothetical protein